MKSLNEQLQPFVNCFISELMSAYRNRYSMNHVLIQLVENWRHTGAVLVDLSKTFDCIPCDLMALTRKLQLGKRALVLPNVAGGSGGWGGGVL